MNKSKAKVQTKVTAATPLWKQFLTGTCVRYTVIALLMLAINALIQNDVEGTMVDTLRFFLCLPLAACLTLAAWVRRTDSLPTGGRVVLHPILVLGGFYLCFYLPYQIQTKPSPAQVLFVLLFVLVLYGIAAGIYAIVAGQSRKRKQEKAPYQSQFRKN